MVYNNSREGSEGIGTLIIFIALILVAAVAAGVLIQSASSLQSKSLDVGRQSQEKITTDIDVVQVYTHDTSDGKINGSGVDTIVMLVRLGSGSNPVRLNDLIVKMDTQSGSQTLTYLSSGAYSQTNYNVTYVVGGTVSPGYLITGDLAEIKFKSQNNVSESQKLTLRLLSKNGAVKPIDVTTPSSMIETTTYLYP